MPVPTRLNERWRTLKRSACEPTEPTEPTAGPGCAKTSQRKLLTSSGLRSVRRAAAARTCSQGAGQSTLSLHLFVPAKTPNTCSLLTCGPSAGQSGHDRCGACSSSSRHVPMIRAEGGDRCRRGVEAERQMGEREAHSVFVCHSGAAVSATRATPIVCPNGGSSCFSIQSNLFCYLIFSLLISLPPRLALFTFLFPRLASAEPRLELPVLDPPATTHLLDSNRRRPTLLDSWEELELVHWQILPQV